MEIAPSPLKAIRKHCLDCCLGQPQEVRLCGAAGHCPSGSLRFGKKVPGVNVLKTIKTHCIECSGSEEPPKSCKATDCALFPFRTGHNPNRKGLGNIKALQVETPTGCANQPPMTPETASDTESMGSFTKTHSCGENEGLKSTMEVCHD